LAKFTPKVEIEVNLNNPEPEIIQCITFIVNAHPGRQHELLQQVDLWIGSELARLERENEPPP
jgi:hypothetical protein